MKPDRWPLPDIEERFEELASDKVLTTLDLYKDYCQVRMSEKCKEKTIFLCRYKTYKFEVMQFGLTNAPLMFQMMMEDFLQGLPSAMMYVDDVIIYSKNMEDHVCHSEQVFGRIQNENFIIKMTKCSFGSSEIKLLGHVAKENRIKVDPGKN